MYNAFYNVRKPQNEPVLSYAPGSPEREKLAAKLREMKAEVLDIPCIIGGKEIRTNQIGQCVQPHDKKHVLANYHIAGPREIEMAIESAMAAKTVWEAMPWDQRVSIFLKAAQLLSQKYRMDINAATMLGQSKNAYQAEIDSACEMIDFLRYNAYFVGEIYRDQPDSTDDCWNKTEYRPLEGFVTAITPFNFTAIGGNLPTAPAMCGNTVVWKPASTAVYSNYLLMKVLMEAGLPAGVINFVPCRGTDFGRIALGHADLAGVHFTGSTAVFSDIWKNVGEHIRTMRSYPRLVGETGGKDFVFAHKSADVDALVTALVRGAFEYQGQKCSAASRAYIPAGLWPQVAPKLEAEIKKIRVGDVCDFGNFVNAVIDQNSFDNIKGYIDYARSSPDADVWLGGDCDDSVGYFVQPTVILAKKADFKTMVEEIFGPVLTIFVYEDADFEKTLDLCANTCSFALTGAVFAQCRRALVQMDRALVNAAGNFYINDKPTGAVVGQQPFGGARGSGTNDKAGSKLNLYRWMSARTVKETFHPATSFDYPFMK